MIRTDEMRDGSESLKRVGIYMNKNALVTKQIAPD